MSMPSFLDKISNFMTNRVDRKKGSSDIGGDHIYCRFCGRKNRVSLTICQDCKRSMDVPPSQMLKVCTKCASAINNDDAYCYSCGTRGF
jgi:Double zinc ribbon